MPVEPLEDPRATLAYERTHLANERTFAAWLRTGISVAAGGIAVAHLVPEPSRDSVTALALGVAFVLLGIAIMAYGAREFADVRHHLVKENSSGGRPEGPSSARAVYGLTAIIAILLLAVLVFLWSHRGQTPSRHLAEGYIAPTLTQTGWSTVDSLPVPDPTTGEAASTSLVTARAITTL